MEQTGRRKGRAFPLFLILLLCLMAASGSLPVKAAAFSKKAPVLTAKQKGTSVTLSWNKRKDLTGYEVWRTNKSGGEARLLRKVKGTSCVRKGLYAGKKYYYRIRGYQTKKGKTVYTSFSKIVSVQVPAADATLKKLLQTGLKPVGSTMYVWGGGWNKADTGAGTEARTMGVSSKWKKFFKKQTASYDYRTTKYQISNGLDCSGYIGWCIYNVMNTKSGNPGYVMYAEKMAKEFASWGWGKYISRNRVKDYRAGDIMSSSCSDCGHVWMVVGQCSDGSVVLLHSSPPGVQLCGTPSKKGTANSKAVKLAASYMKKYYPEWYKKYPNCARGSSYLSHYSQMRWSLSSSSVMADPDGYRNMSAEQILKDLFS